MSETLRKEQGRTGILRMIFGEKKLDSSPRNRVAVSRAVSVDKVEKGSVNISHDPALIDHLQEDHVKLVELFLLVENTMKANNFESSTFYLREFQKLLRDHVTEEDFRFYGYLRYHDDKDGGGMDFSSCQIEMRKIRISVRDFVDSYLKIGIGLGNKDMFLNSWCGLDGRTQSAITSRQMSMKTTLLERIQFEEARLYPAYLSIGNN